MDEKVSHDAVEDALRRCGSNWDAAQAHGLLSGRLAVAGVPAGPDWLLQVLEATDEQDASRGECQTLLDRLYQMTYWQLSERLSEFEPLLPADGANMDARIAALAHWSEGFLHGLVSARNDEQLKQRLAVEPLSEVIKDLLQITRADVDGDIDQEENESAYVELVEYLRVAAQLSYEELADIRNARSSSENKPS